MNSQNVLLICTLSEQSKRPAYFFVKSPYTHTERIGANYPHTITNISILHPPRFDSCSRRRRRSVPPLLLGRLATQVSPERTRWLDCSAFRPLHEKTGIYVLFFSRNSKKWDFYIIIALQSPVQGEGDNSADSVRPREALKDSLDRLTCWDWV